MKKNKIKIVLNFNNIKEFINIVSSFSSDIDLIKGNYVVDAKSIMGILSLDFTRDTYVQIHSDNKEEIERFKNEMKRYE